ncbi:MAG: hypothetical protein KGH99_01550 [Thaumarchaeota archaeon]|nr:hypothetical protein [Nitrososphaerota archaeon]MDE1872144.1 hypothetical protein [Nitrososphaerota archaeon]
MVFSKIIIVIASLVLLTSMFSVQNVFADYFQDFPARLKHSPVLCAMEPQPDSQFPGIGKELLDKTNYAVMDWSDKLNQGYGKHPSWNITLIEVPLVKQKTFDNSTCDVTINYFKKPSNQQLEFVAAGVTIPNFEEGKTRIEIYYDGIQVLARYTQWTVGGTTYYEYIPYPIYTGFLAGDVQLDGAIRHEIGHSFGLGHYIVPNEELKRITQGQEDMPSIMIPIETAVGVTYFDITSFDIAELKSIYGLNGFGSQTPLNQYNRLSVIETDKDIYSAKNTVSVKVDTSNFDDQEYAQLMTLDPENKLIDIFDVSKSNSTFTFNNENQTGKYYVEMIDPYKDLYDFTSFNVGTVSVDIPVWVKNTAKWWSNNQIHDSDFIQAVQYLINQGIITVPPSQVTFTPSQQIPAWIKNNAGWWANGQISDDEFIKAIQYLVSSGIIQARP